MIILVFFLLIHLLQATSAPLVDIIIVVSDRTEYSAFHSSINSLIRFRSDEKVIYERIILVDNNSSIVIKQYMNKICTSKSILLCTSTANLHIDSTQYSVAVKTGIVFGKLQTGTEADTVVLLSSHAIVTDGWLTTLYNALEKGDPKKLGKIGMVGPISNYAGFQSVPQLPGKMERSRNDLPPGLDLDTLSNRIRCFADQNNVGLIELDVLNAICLMFQKQLLDEVDIFDPPDLIRGFGEEVGLSMKITKSGYQNYLVPSSYVFMNFGEQNNLDINFIEINKRNEFTEYYDHLIQSSTQMEKLRNYIIEIYRSYHSSFPNISTKKSILFLLHDVGISGGTISILQESLQMYKYGIKVALAFPVGSALFQWRKVMRSILPGVSEKILSDLVVQIDGKSIFPDISPSFYTKAKHYDIVVATYCFTMRFVSRLATHVPQIVPAYYVQDYEAWFFENPFENTTYNERDNWQLDRARMSYIAMDKSVYIFAKTHWTKNMVQSHHNVSVQKIQASIDHTVFYPNRTSVALKLEKTWKNSSFQLIAMIRPKTPRRNAIDTLDTMLRIAHDYRNINVSLYGCDRNDLNTTLYDLLFKYGPAPHRKVQMLKRPNIKILGKIVEREDMASIYRSSDMFIDASWWQAFGRSAIEAMACGVVSVLPSTGAGREICAKTFMNETSTCTSFVSCETEMFSCLYFNGTDTEEYYKQVISLLRNDSRRRSLIIQGIEKTREFTVEAASASIADYLMGVLPEYRQKKGSTVKKISHSTHSKSNKRGAKIH